MSFDISCKLSPKENCHSLFSGKNIKKTYCHLSSAELAHWAVKVEIKASPCTFSSVWIAFPLSTGFLRCTVYLCYFWDQFQFYLILSSVPQHYFLISQHDFLTPQHDFLIPRHNYLTCYLKPIRRWPHGSEIKTRMCFALEINVQWTDTQ